ncbi:ROK family protein [Paenibacillus sp. NEAU-GSW1]|uniref:ROK family protein n=1 Tax=Paenibacillus sp. NEAU-GSW1 TaxID=2682486 RepID=UPI0012E1FEFB|nr:ROK family protein [Paenibacillus sp. NEAU-GSW1]MUT65789.1 ROK family protein [Paenibacillus sp. NEAU-GSW1]
MRIGAIEAGGTKFICGIGNEHGVIEESVSFPTEQPNITLGNVIRYFSDKGVEAIGIGSFGPIDLQQGSPTYGSITTTPKPGWSSCNFLGLLQQSFQVPYGWDTDVNAAAYGEAVWGAAKGVSSCLYYTIGTGVGVGVFTEGRLVHGLVHPEGGHMLTRRHPQDEFPGICPYHGDCLEGMAAGPAIEARWKQKGFELPADHPAWDIEAYYIAQAVANAILLVSPQKVILGGGVMGQSQLFPLIREAVRKNLNGYVSAAAITENIDQHIVPPGLGHQAGLYGALALGVRAYEQAQMSAGRGLTGK